MNPVEFLIFLFLAFFAGHRLVIMLQDEDGPLNIFVTFRSLMAEIIFKLGELESSKWNWLYYIISNIDYGFNCWSCLSVWIYAGLTALILLNQPLTLFQFVAIWLGLSGTYLFTRKKGWL